MCCCRCNRFYCAFSSLRLETVVVMLLFDAFLHSCTQCVHQSNTNISSSLFFFNIVVFLRLSKFVFCNNYSFFGEEINKRVEVHTKIWPISSIATQRTCSFGIRYKSLTAGLCYILFILLLLSQTLITLTRMGSCILAFVDHGSNCSNDKLYVLLYMYNGYMQWNASVPSKPAERRYN